MVGGQPAALRRRGGLSLKFGVGLLLTEELERFTGTHKRVVMMLELCWHGDIRAVSPGTGKLMDHLVETDNVAVHDALDLFEAQIELLVLNLLDPDYGTAIAQITTARDRADDRIMELAKDCSLMSENAKAIRIAAGMLTKTYKRLIDTIEHKRALAEESSRSQLHL
jgi:hypothetical protein